MWGKDCANQLLYLFFPVSVSGLKTNRSALILCQTQLNGHKIMIIILGII